MRKSPQQRHPSHAVEYRENTTTHGRRLKRDNPRHQQELVYGGSDSFASATDTFSEDDVLDVDVLEEIERGYFEQLRQQQYHQQLEVQENNVLPQPKMPLLITASAPRDPVAGSELRQHSRKPEPKARRRTDASGHKHRKRKTRVPEESPRPDEYVYATNDENLPSTELAIVDVRRQSTDTASNSDAASPDTHVQQTKVHRRKTTSNAGAKPTIYWRREANVSKKRDSNRRRATVSTRRDSNSSGHSTSPHLDRYETMQTQS